MILQADLQRGLPTDDELTIRISHALSLHGSVRILERTPNVFASTFPTEIVRCELPDSSDTVFFCKHSYADAARPEASPQFYEIDIYRRLLRNIPLSLPGFVGAWTDFQSGEGLLMLQFLDSTTRVSKMTDPDKWMERAAIWSASFHRYAAELLELSPVKFVQPRAIEPFRDRCRTLMDSFSREQGGGYSGWISALYDRFSTVTHIVNDAPVTVIHGEYYPQNILVHNERIYPVDWETARIGMGEFDLATLVEGWSQPVIDRCVKAYSESIDDAEVRDGVRSRFVAAQMLMDIYWLSLYPDPAPDKMGVMRENWRREHLRESAELLGVI